MSDAKHDAPDQIHYDELIRNLREMSQHLAKDAEDAIARSAAAIAHSAAELVEQTKKQAGPVIEKAGKEVREHPVTTAALVAASIGLMGYALAHGRKQ